ncbi:PREDICTED: uncharacterized protein LOC104591381 [Nelumbo nucifera]|uniref:Uncharacterized protein LOC104591381 n=1 Tax=Nelumbo nucifera TaxID=4432 RepID=A0A1U7Z5D2_NELNU|nr:PREDICTED: uncharacterized protein LOC104591381 [Nelumbo nucifera]
MDMFAIHGDLHKIILYVTYTEAKCVSMDDGCSGKGKEQMQDDDDDVDCYVVDDDDDDDDVAGHSHGNDEGLDDHHDVDDGEFKGLYDDCDAYWEDDGEDYSDEDGGDQESSDGGDHEGSDEDDGNEGVHDGGSADLFDYEPTSDYDSPRERGNTLEFDFSIPRFRVGMEFTNVKEFRQTLRQYCVVEGIEIKRKKNEKCRFIGVCVVVDCGWRIHASLSYDGGNFIVKTLNDTHSCIRVTTNRKATNTWVSTKIEGLLRADPTMSSSVLRSEIRIMFVIDVTWRKVHRAKLKVVDRIRGSLADSYAILPQYCTTLLASNPRSVVKLHAPLDSEENTYEVFKRVFICLASPRDGFLDGCRKIIQLDGCHTKTGAIGGIILTAVGIDGNNENFPIAYSIVEAESRDSWTWFLVELRDALGIDDAHRWTFMLDRQKGIVEAVSCCMPGANHRFCLRHLYNNFKNLFKGKPLKDVVWAAGKSYTQSDFVHYMERHVADHDHTQSTRRKVFPPRRRAISTQVVASSSSGATSGSASGMSDRGGRTRGRGRGRGRSISGGIGGRVDTGNLQHPDIVSLGRQVEEQSSQDLRYSQP